VIAGLAEVAIEQVFLGGQLATAHRYARRLAKSWEDFGGKLQDPTETHMIWLNLEPAGVAGDTSADLAKCHGVLTMRRRL
jgi:threonine aldolase